MKTRNVITLISILFVFISCSKKTTYIYEVIDVKAKNADNSGKEAILSLTDSISKNSYAIQLEYTMAFKDDYGSIGPDNNIFSNGNKVSAFNFST